MDNIELINENKQIETEIIDKQPKSVEPVNFIASEEIEDGIEIIRNSNINSNINSNTDNDSDRELKIDEQDQQYGVVYYDSMTNEPYVWGPGDYGRTTCRGCCNMCKCLKLNGVYRYSDKNMFNQLIYWLDNKFINRYVNTCKCQSTYYRFSCDCKVCE